MNVFQMIAVYFSYSFVRYAFIAGVLTALCASVLGVTLVLKRYSFIGDGLSHVAFGAMAIAAVLSVTNEMIIVMPLTVLCAVLLLAGGSHAKIKGDAALAMLSVGAMAIGYLLLNCFSTSANISGDVCSTLFGSTSILTLTAGDVALCVIMSALVMLLFLLFYNKIFAITFDEDFSKAIGIQTGLYNLVGALLTSALMIFPALSAMRVYRAFRQVILCAAVIAVVTSALGILISIMCSTPVGATIVSADALTFGCFCLAGRVSAKLPPA